MRSTYRGQRLPVPKGDGPIYSSNERGPVACATQPETEHCTPLMESCVGPVGAAPEAVTMAPILTVFLLLASSVSQVELASVLPETVPPENPELCMPITPVSQCTAIFSCH